MLSALGASILWVRFLAITNCWVEMWASRLSQLGLLVITASTLTRSQVGLFRISVADCPEPVEPQADNASNAERHARYRITFHPWKPDDVPPRPPTKRRSFRKVPPAMQAESPSRWRWALPAGAGQHRVQDVVTPDKVVEEC